MQKVDKKVAAGTHRAEAKQTKAAAGQPQTVGAMTAMVDACFDLAAAEVDGTASSAFAINLVNQLRSSKGASEMLGLIGKCQLPDCDVHMLTTDLEIVRHLRPSDPTPAGFSEARRYLQCPHDGVVAVLVYTDRLEAVLVDGNVMPLTDIPR